MNTLIRFYIHMLIRRSPILIGIVILFTGFALAFAINQPDRYSSSAKLLVEPPQIPSDLALSTVNTSIAEELQILEQRLLRRETLIDVANKLNAYPPSEDGTRMSPNQVAAAMRANTRVEVRTRRGQASFVDIAFESGNPQVASQVVNELVTRALQDNVRMRTESAGNTLEFFEREVDRLTSELAQQANAIAQYKSRNSGSLPEALNFRLGRERTLEERLSSLNREFSSLDEQRTRVVAVYEQTGQLSRPVENTSPEQRQLASLEAELAAALAVYSETNPRVTVLRTRVNQLRSIVASQAPLAGTTDTGSTVYEVTLAELDAKQEALQVEISNTETELAELRTQIEKTPQTSIGLDALERDYTNIQRQYNDAVTSLNAAKTGEIIELSAQGQRISVVEPAVPPLHPSSPNRKVITAAGGMAGVALAAGLFALLEIINSSIRRPTELVNRIGITPFATLPDIKTSRQRRYSRLVKVGVALLLFVILPAAMYFIDQHVMSLGDILAYVRRLI